MLALLSALAVVSACGRTPPPSLQLLGMGVSVRDVNQVASLVEAESGRVLPQNVTISFEPDSFPCHPVDGKGNKQPQIRCIGLLLPGNRIRVTMRDRATHAPTRNVASTSLAHELVHVLYRDPDHARADLWGPTGMVFRINRKARIFSACADACQSKCQK